MSNTVAAGRSWARKNTPTQNVAGYEGTKQPEETNQKTDGVELRIPAALDRLIEPYTALDKPDEVQSGRRIRPPRQTTNDIRAEKKLPPRGNVCRRRPTNRPGRFGLGQLALGA